MSNREAKWNSKRRQRLVSRLYRFDPYMHTYIRACTRWTRHGCTYGPSETIGRFRLTCMYLTRRDVLIKFTTTHVSPKAKGTKGLIESFERDRLIFKRSNEHLLTRIDFFFRISKRNGGRGGKKKGKERRNKMTNKILEIQVSR